MTQSYPGYDLLVVGSSLAAVSLSQRATQQGLKVLLLEGGQDAESAYSRELTVNEEFGHFRAPHWSNHWVRAVGGTSRRWAGQVAVLDERDLDGSTATPRWPISYRDLLPYYMAAADFLGRPRYIIQQPAQAILGGAARYKPFSRSVDHAGVVKFSTSAAVQATARADLKTDVNVVRLMTDDRRSVKALQVHSRTAGPSLIKVLDHQRVVLACGGLGNAQVLLQPNGLDAVGVGNESGLAGKFLMEHPHVRDCGRAYVTQAFVRDMTGSIDAARFGPHVPALTLSDAQKRKLGALGCTLELEGLHAADDALARYFANKFRSPMLKATLFARSEQQPLSLNAVSLTSERNTAGAFKLRVECSFSALDLMSIFHSTRRLGELLYENGAGAFKIENDSIFRSTRGGGHTMGTTRMGASPADSVCDRDCRVHGYWNLYLAGSSVFPSSGTANPSMTLVALAQRLGDHLVNIVRKAKK